MSTPLRAPIAATAFFAATQPVRTAWYETIQWLAHRLGVDAQTPRAAATGILENDKWHHRFFDLHAPEMFARTPRR